MSLSLTLAMNRDQGYDELLLSYVITKIQQKLASKANKDSET